jgi:NTP pyrophosphatase (non-canonical NTP hydrolase)
MNFNDYQLAAQRTWNNRDLTKEQRLSNACLGLAGEVGEVLEPIKKYLYHGKPLPEAEVLIKELGDVLYYASVLANELGITFDVVAETNIAKLKARHPNGFRGG